MLLDAFKKENRAAFVPFVVAGHPSLNATEKFVDVLVAEGADIIELGVPFSDATADGPVIQTASELAAKKIDSIQQIIELGARIKAKHPKLPIVLFTYFNPIFRMGLQTFAEQCRAATIDAVLVVDLPLDEADAFCAALQTNQVKAVFLASPTTPRERARKLAEASTGFLYYVSRVGVTGVQSDLSQTLGEELTRLREVTEDHGIAVGFGIATGAQAARVARMADAVVVGSAFVKLISEHSHDENAALASVRDLAREIAQAVKTARQTQDKP